MRDDQGAVLEVPAGWEHLPPGDALLTRRVKTGPCWVVSEKRGNKVFSRGLWAPAENIARAEAAVERERASPEYARRLASGRARREREQVDYVVEFTRHVLAFLAFHPRHAAFATALAERVARHATPVGSGTVARTERIPVAERAEAAVIAWMRHQTTAYDRMSILRIKGERREVRRRLAQRSRELLERYRCGEAVAPDCPLAAALAPLDGGPPASPVLERAPIERPAPVLERAPIERPAPAVERAPIERPAPAVERAAERQDERRPVHGAGPQLEQREGRAAEGEEERRLARMKAVRERLGRR